MHAPRIVIVAGDLVDHAPHGPAHVLAFDRDHRVGDALDDLLLLRRREDAFDQCDLDQRHAVLLAGRGVMAVMVHLAGSAHIGHIPDIDP